MVPPYARSDPTRTAAFLAWEMPQGRLRPTARLCSREAPKLRTSSGHGVGVFEYGDPSGLIGLGEGSKMRPPTAAPNTRQEHSKLTPRLYRGPLLVPT